MPEASASLSIVYSDFRANDFSPAAAFGGEDTPGFTMYVSVAGIPQTSPVTGLPTTCSLSISFGDPTGSPRIGKTFHYGPAEFDIPTDGVIVAMVSVGYLKTNNFGLLGGATLNIPAGLAGSTVAAYFDAGNSGSNVNTATVYVQVPEPFTSGGAGPPLTEQPKNIKLTNPSFDSLNRLTATIEFDYYNTLVENPFDFAIRAEDKTGATHGVSYTHPAFVAGTTHYSITMLNPMDAWSVTSENPITFTVHAERSNGTTSPSSNPISISNSTTGIYAPLYPSTLYLAMLSSGDSNPSEQQVTPLLLVGNVSGIYTLVDNQRVDELYLRPPFLDSIETQNVQIPDPYVKTGFFP